jgi:hypothetical protein
MSFRTPEVILFSEDVERAVAFYSSLGFAETFRVPTEGDRSTPPPPLRKSQRAAHADWRHHMGGAGASCGRRLGGDSRTLAQIRQAL